MPSEAGLDPSPLVTFTFRSKRRPAPAPADCHKAGSPTGGVRGTRMLGQVF